MACPRPVVLDSCTELTGIVNYLLRHEGHLTTVVVCSAKAEFIRDLKIAGDPDRQRPSSAGGHDNLNEAREEHEPQAEWQIPTLRTLTASKSVSLVFCPSVQHLRAYLASFALRKTCASAAESVLSSTDRMRRRLLVLNLVSLHKEDSSLSAQSLNRTFSVAVEAACHTESQLIFAEYCLLATAPISNVSDDTGPMAAEESTSPSVPMIWDEQVSMLNVTTKSFGVGDRGWVGRTVSIRQIAGRSCDFESLESLKQRGFVR